MMEPIDIFVLVVLSILTGCSIVFLVMIIRDSKNHAMIEEPNFFDDDVCERCKGCEDYDPVFNCSGYIRPCEWYKAKKNEK